MSIKSFLDEFVKPPHHTDGATYFMLVGGYYNGDNILQIIDDCLMRHGLSRVVKVKKAWIEKEKRYGMIEDYLTVPRYKIQGEFKLWGDLFVFFKINDSQAATH